eukprot:TRINITY_DN2405_c0_g3_i1.p1 TRINITY_DN2405_c0_g3~~TRINITY_DN2405_c0_g3_i1.p1  ORF type:complete len:1115 (-),score=454.54 TRINITY_DN2405_c0_g3_i1:95-3439(-)
MAKHNDEDASSHDDIDDVMMAGGGADVGGNEVHEDFDSDEEGDEENCVIATIKNFSKIEKKKVHSEQFELDDEKWTILCFPKGNNVKNLSLYLESVSAKEKRDFNLDSSFSLTVLNKDPNKNKRQRASHTFKHTDVDWGFTNFMNLERLNDPTEGFLEGDELRIRVYVQSKEEPRRYQMGINDSRRSTGYVGLKNQGATCYMNSLLQTLYHNIEFRKAVFELPTDDDWETINEKPTIPLALQKLFYNLQFSNKGVSTKELTKSFGWDIQDAFAQHDVQELNRVLCDNLENKMKGTKSDGTIDRLFSGNTKKYIKCVDVEYESSRKELYSDIQLLVKGCKNIYESFDKYCEEETLEGDNKYKTDDFGYQVAKMGTKFSSFPPVLNLQLRRFEYDFQRDAMAKVNDRYEFPLDLDLSKYIEYDDDDEERPVPIYRLYAILVHRGDVHAGHYYAYIRPTLKKQWYQFNDDRVNKVKKREAVDESFGGEEVVSYRFQGRNVKHTHKKIANAYMLVYVRESDKEQYLGKFKEDCIPAVLKEKIESERIRVEEEKKRKREAHLYVNVRIALKNESFDHHAPERFDLINFENPEEVHIVRIKKAYSLEELKKKVQNELAYTGHQPDPKEQRYWLWQTRQNKTYRPFRALDEDDEEKRLSDFNNNQSTLDVLLELPSKAGECHAPIDSEETGLIFFKYFDIYSQEVQFVDHQILSLNSNYNDIVDLVKNLKKIPQDTDIEIYEEIHSGYIEPLDPEATLGEQQIGNGDIIIFSLAFTQENLDNNPMYKSLSLSSSTTILTKQRNIPDYYEYIISRVSVGVHLLSEPNKPHLDLELSKKMTYNEVAIKIAENLENVGPEYLRFTGYNPSLEKPNRFPIPYSDEITLNDMLTVLYKPTPIKLFYEVLAVPLSELESKHMLKIKYQDIRCRTDENSNIEILCEKNSPISHVLEEAQKLIKKSEASGQYRLMQTVNNKISKIFNPEKDIVSDIDFDEVTSLLLEEKSQEETEMKETDRLIPVAHIEKQGLMLRPFGNPFMIQISPDQKVESLKEIIKEKLKVSNAEFDKWQFSLISYGRSTLLDDEDVILDQPLHSVTYIGLIHKKDRYASEYRHHNPGHGIVING